MATPQFFGADGVLREKTVLSTSVPQHFFEGTLPSGVAEVLVSVYGEAFSANPDYVTFEGDRFVVPNPSAFPDGLQLFPGSNLIRVQCVLSSGTITGEATITAYLSTDSDVRRVATAPSGVTLERFDSTVVISVEGVADAQGYHVYASPSPGGGEVGYFRVNPSLLTSGTTSEVVDSLAELSADADVPLDPDGFPTVDPLYLRVRGTFEDQTWTTTQTLYNDRLSVPETTQRVRTRVEVSTVRQVELFSFEHDRQGTLNSVHPSLPHSALSAVPEDLPLYYVVSAVYQLDGVEVESAFSPEVVGQPLRLTPSVGSLPQVPRTTMVQSMVESIHRSHPEVRIDAGSALRDTVIDPFTTELDRIRFLLDFFHNAQSFTTLLLIDDPSFTGASIPVSQSSYKRALKTALYLTSDEAVQAVIDNAFDKLASNVSVVRELGKRSRGEVLFEISQRPVSAISKPIGTVLTGGGYTFRTTSAALIVGSGGGYNPVTGTYSARAYIQADAVGAAGNLAPNQVRTIVGDTLGLKVRNVSRLFGGRDRESNLDLATRSQRVLSSVDTGTSEGYRQTVLSVPGVTQAVVAGAGDPLMLRDMVGGVHLGGKVDVYLRGGSSAQVTDNFAFSFETRTRQQFEPVGDLSDLIFRAVDSSLSTENPLIEMLEIPQADLYFENVTQGYVFSLQDATVTGYNTVQLSSTYNDPSTLNLTDELRGSYRLRTSDRYIPTRQPVTEVLSLVGSVSGTVDPSLYSLYRASDPLLLGGSSDAGDYVKVTIPEGNSLRIPSALPMEVVGEEHVLLSEAEYLTNIGVIPLTIRVFNMDRTVEYNGPNSTAVRDFTVVFSDVNSPTGILPTTGGRLSEGDQVLVDYSHDENFVLTYTSNSVLNVAQQVLDSKRHMTADVLAKGAIECPVDISATVALSVNAKASMVDSQIRTALARLFSGLSLGTPLRQSDVIRQLDEVSGVDYVVTPLSLMSYGEGSLLVRESVPVTVDSDAMEVAAWQTGETRTWLLQNVLTGRCAAHGGAVSDARGVYLSGQGMSLVNTPPNLAGYPLVGHPQTAYLIGYSGMVLPGYSDDATIQSSYPLPSDPAQRATEVQEIRARLTGSRVLLCLPRDISPVGSDVAVTYVTGAPGGVQNLTPNAITALTLGNLTLTFDA